MKELHLGQMSYMIHMNGSNYSPRGAFGAPLFYYRVAPFIS